MNHISLATAKQLKEWGCEIESAVVRADHNDRLILYGGKHDLIIKEGVTFDESVVIYPSYDIREIICNGEMAKAFFGEEFNARFGSKTCSHIEMIVNLLSTKKQEEAEQYLLDNCIFNPSNK